MSDVARAALIEIVETGAPVDDGSLGASVIVPNEVRINGQPLLCSEAHPIKIHEVDINDRSYVLVTLTLYARRIEVKPEPA